ncbi:hypothetical protein M4D76_27200 [Peribacillus frigoritolerans]|uniref:hypothetical protein n=1 Tax=Bacillaceae TaxID=186817 RepID=UPI00066201EF|nr:MULTISPECIES: hypothetical protein [Bacillaceae]MCT1391937.1 hypothetical protein [Peribacillus frigoritolerans]
MSIKIGDKNKIKNSSIGHQYGSTNGNNQEPDKKKSFADKHPIIISIYVSVLVGFIFLFSFWGNIVDWVESFFR